METGQNSKPGFLQFFLQQLKCKLKNWKLIFCFRGTIFDCFHWAFIEETLKIVPKILTPELFPQPLKKGCSKMMTRQNVMTDVWYSLFTQCRFFPIKTQIFRVPLSV